MVEFWKKDFGRALIEQLFVLVLFMFRFLSFFIKYPIVSVFVVSFIFLISLEILFVSKTPDKTHFQKYSSDDLMQTLPIKQLRQSPFMSILYLHKQPPGLDFIRIIANRFVGKPVNNEDMVSKTDKVLYVFWAFLFSLMATMVYKITKMFTSAVFSMFATAIWIIHPSPIYYSTFMDATMITSVLTLCLFYEILNFRKNKSNSVLIALICIFLFYLKTVFQWYFFIPVFISLFLLNASKKQLIQFLIVILIFVTPYLIKQKLLFDTFSTTTFAGYHLTGVVGYYPSKDEVSNVKSHIKFNYPKSAVNYSGTDKFNTEVNYEDNLIYTQIFKLFCKANPIKCFININKSFAYNMSIFWGPSYFYMPNIIIDNLPWINIFNYLLNKYVFMFLTCFSFVIWVILDKNKKEQKRWLAVFLPFIYIFVMINLGNRYFWSEAMRLKFILEPIFYVMILIHIYLLVRRAAQKKIVEKVSQG